MPRTKKPAGTAVNPRNGRRTGVAPSALERFALPKRSGESCLLETRKAWNALWDDPVAKALTPVDRPVVIRWAHSIDRALWALELADAEPISTGSMDQEVESPYYGIADKALKVAQACEAQLGVGALNRARLGIALIQERASLDEMNDRLRRPVDAPKRPDPRTVPGAVVG